MREMVKINTLQLIVRIVVHTIKHEGRQKRWNT